MPEIVTAEALDLSKYLRRGDRVVFGQACGEPTTLVEALIAGVSAGSRFGTGAVPAGAHDR